MGRTKYSGRFCAYCNKETRMVQVGTMEGIQGKTWFRCTRCHHAALLEEESVDKAQAELEPSQARVYNPWQSFHIGESIFHQEWNEVGKVLSKIKMSDGNQAIVVSFEIAGQRRLIENLKPEEPVESEIVS
ncbi:MAG: hypothetical protein HZB59_04310 [Ignavibacteriales bacterium]|nr:hypothetical protein [Ignavibacteriales bacterium]